MKQILSFLLLIIMFTTFYFLKTEEVIDKQLKYDNITINYPYFSNYNINGYIKNYINSLVLNNKNKLIIDYDYNDINNTLTFYKTEINSNIINSKISTFKISKNKFTKVNNIKKVNDYDFYNNKYIDKNTKLVAFTFDDGPNYNTSKVIDILNKYNVTATFFITGKNIKGNEKVLEKLYEYNMEIGNHTYNHLLLTKYNKDKIQEEIETTNNLIYDIVGSYPKLLRPSYGSVNKKIKDTSNMPIIIWNIDTLDWKNKNSNKIANKILDKVKDGDIILMHDIYKATLNSLDIVIPKLLENGYQIVSVSELFYYKEIELQNGKVYGYAK